jgi:hypothetical protein
MARARIVPQGLSGLVALLSFLKGFPLGLGWVGVLLAVLGVGETELSGIALVGGIGALVVLTAVLAAQAVGVFRSRRLVAAAAGLLTVLDGAALVAVAVGVTGKGDGAASVTEPDSPLLYAALVGAVLVLQGVTAWWAVNVAFRRSNRASAP